MLGLHDLLGVLSCYESGICGLSFMWKAVEGAVLSTVFFVVHSLENGTRCRDGVNVLWCRSHLVWLVFEGSIPTCACFHSENFFVTCSCCFFFLLFFRSSKREERQARGRYMVCRV